jgi:hypothetical protein
MDRVVDAMGRAGIKVIMGRPLFDPDMDGDGLCVDSIVEDQNDFRRDVQPQEVLARWLGLSGCSHAEPHGAFVSSPSKPLRCVHR